MTIDGEAFRSQTAVGANKRLDELDLSCGLVERAQEPSELFLPVRAESHNCMAVSVLALLSHHDESLFFQISDDLGQIWGGHAGGFL